MPTAAQVGRGRGQRPTSAVDANFLGNLFKLSVAKVVKQIFSSSILGVFKTLGHDAGSGEMPEINAFVVVTADKQVEQPIAVVIEQREAAAGRFEDVILGGTSAVHFPRQLRTDIKGHRHGRGVSR